MRDYVVLFVHQATGVKFWKVFKIFFYHKSVKREVDGAFFCFVFFANLYIWLILSTDATTYAHFLFNAFDIDRNGSIRFEDFVIGLSVLLRGSVTEKLNWAFNLYDINKDGYITKEVCLSYGIKC